MHAQLSKTLNRIALPWILDTIINEEEPEVIEKRNNAARSRLVAALLLVVVISGVSYVVDAIEAED